MANFICVGTFQNGKVEIIPNSYGKRVSPSYAAFSGSERLLGDSAFDQSAYNPLNTVYEIKRLVGRNFDDESVLHDMMLVPFKVVKDKNKIKVEVEYHGKTRKFVPEEYHPLFLQSYPYEASGRSLS